MSKQKYSKGTIYGDKKTKWICGCFRPQIIILNFVTNMIKL